MSLFRIVVIAALASAAAFLWQNPPVGSASEVVGAIERSTEGGTDPGGVAIPEQLQPLDAYAVITEKTLFYPDRKPPAAPVKQAPKAEAEPEYVLRGVLLVPGGAMALIGRDDGELPARVRVGDTLGAWTVNAIEPLNVTLNKDGGAELKLPLERNIGPPPKNPRIPLEGMEPSGLQPGKLPTVDANNPNAPPAEPPEAAELEADGRASADATNKTQDEATQ